MHFDHYTRCLWVYVSATSAVFACAAAALGLGNVVAAVLGFTVALVVGWRLDEVSRRFRTDVERVLEPNDETKTKMIPAICGGFVVIAALALMVAPEIAAASGIFVMFYIMKGIIK